MVIHPNQLSSEIRPSTGKHGEPLPAIHRAQPHPVQLRYQYHKNVWLSSHHNTIGQSVQSRKSVAPSKNIRYTLYSTRDYTTFFYLYQHFVRHDCRVILFFTRALAQLDAQAGLRGPCFATSFLSTVRQGLARKLAPRPQAAQLPLCTPENLVSRDDSNSTLSVLY